MAQGEGGGVGGAVDLSVQVRVVQRVLGQMEEEREGPPSPTSMRADTSAKVVLKVS